MKRLFISVLGTGFYDKTKYTKESGPVRFVQLPILNIINAQTWSKDDKILFLLTKEAREKNWSKEISARAKTHEPNKIQEYIGLEQELINLNYTCKIETLDITKGDNEQEIGEIFSQLFEQVEEGDELYFDLTHGFRYLPMLVLVFSNYIRFLKNATVKHLSYGSYNPDTKESSIVDLMALAQIQEWTNASNILLQAGDASKIKQLTEEIVTPLNKKYQGKHKQAKSLQSFSKTITKAIQERAMCRGLDIYKGDNVTKSLQALTTYKELHGNNDNSKNSETWIRPLAPILEKIENSALFLDAKKDSGFNLIHASKWCYEHNQIQQAYTLLQEGVVTVLCDFLNFDNVSHKNRVAITACLKNYDKETEWKGDKEEVSLMHKVKSTLPISANFCNTFTKLSNNRNDLNHAGINKRSLKIVTAISRFEEDYLFFTNYLNNTEFKQLINTLKNKELAPIKNTILINLSNHPSSKWSDLQIKAAGLYGQTIIDIEFPKIKINSNRGKIIKSIIAEIEDVIEKHKALATVHIMGEMVLTYQLVNELKKRGIMCISSFSERISKEIGENKKTSEFNFEYFIDF